MAAETGIAWTDSTANLWIGCSHASRGCDNCYAEADFADRKKRVEWGPKGTRSYCKAGWALIRQMQRRAMANGGVDPALGRRRRVFVNSLSDIFDNHRSIDPWREAAFAVLEEAHNLDLILVTKRPQNIQRFVPPHWLNRGWPPHVWLLVSTEDTREAGRRIPVLRRIREMGKIRVIGASVEPMLEEIDHSLFRGLDWIIVGGESGGKKARPMNPDWARYLRIGARLAGQHFFFKQTTNKGPIPGDLMVREFPR